MKKQIGTHIHLMKNKFLDNYQNWKAKNFIPSSGLIYWMATVLISTRRLIAISLASARCMSASMAFRMPSEVLAPRSSWRSFMRNASAAAFYIRPMRSSPTCVNILSHMSSLVCSRRFWVRRCKRLGRLSQLRARFNWQ